MNRGVAERAGSRRRQKWGWRCNSEGVRSTVLQEFRKFVWKCAAMTPYRVPHLAGPRVGRRLRPGKESTAGEKASADEKNAAGKRASLGRKEKNIRRGGDCRQGEA